MACYHQSAIVLFIMFVFLFLTTSSQTNTNIQLCNSNTGYLLEYMKCNFAADEVPVPLPHNCLPLKVNSSCISASNYKIPLESDSIAVTLDNHTWGCAEQHQFKNNTLPTSSFRQLLRIEMFQVEKIYAIYVSKAYSISSVKVLRSVLNDNPTRFTCFGRETITRTSIRGDQFNEFYCYEINDFTDESIGIDANTIEIKFARGSHFINACEFQKHIKIFSYPRRLCGTPGSYEGQTFEPKRKFYLPGQKVSYKCFSTSSINFPVNVERTCQENGFWNRRAPICISGPSFYPESCYVTNKFGNIPMSVENCYALYMRSGQKNINYPLTDGKIPLCESCCTLFNFNKYYEAEKVGITFDYGDKKGMLVYYVTDNQFIPLQTFKHSQVIFKGKSLNRTNWYTSITYDKRTVPKPFKVKQIIVLGTKNSGDDFIQNLILYKPTDKEEDLSISECPSVDSVPKAKWLVYPKSHPNIGYWSCDRGYYEENKMSDMSVPFSCSGRIWNGTPPDCKRRYCNSSEIITENTLSNITNRYKKKSMTVNSTLIYRCLDGKTILGTSNESSIVVICQENGQWTTSQVKCVNTEVPYQGSTKAYPLVGIVIGGTIGGIALLTLLTSLGCYYFRKNRKLNIPASYINVKDRRLTDLLGDHRPTEDNVVYDEILD